MTIGDWMELHPIALGFIVFWFGVAISMIGPKNSSKDKEE